jgi:hypothetical protein
MTLFLELREWAFSDKNIAKKIIYKFDEKTYFCYIGVILHGLQDFDITKSY